MLETLALRNFKMELYSKKLARRPIQIIVVQNTHNISPMSDNRRETRRTEVQHFN